MLIRSWFLEKYLNVYQQEQRKLLLLKHGRDFLEQEDEIISLLKETEFYHGTGAYHYYFPKNKYEEGTPKIGYSLRHILRNGLVPQLDLFNDTFKTGSSKTLSLTSNRAYARGYAQMFFPENQPLEYVYGPLNIWLYHIIKRVLIGFIINNLSLEKLFKIGEESEPRKRYNKTSLHWTRSFRKDGKYEGKSMLKQMNGRTDIPNNFGIIIGTRKGAVKLVDVKYPNFEKDERRTNRTILPRNFSHIQVPLKYLQLVKKECKHAGLEVPIIPMEFVELHNYRLGLIKLIRLTQQNGNNPLAFS